MDSKTFLEVGTASTGLLLHRSIEQAFGMGQICFFAGDFAGKWRQVHPNQTSGFKHRPNH